MSDGEETAESPERNDYASLMVLDDLLLALSTLWTVRTTEDGSLSLVLMMAPLRSHNNVDLLRLIFMLGAVLPRFAAILSVCNKRTINNSSMFR